MFNKEKKTNEISSSHTFNRMHFANTCRTTDMIGPTSTLDQGSSAPNCHIASTRCQCHLPRSASLKKRSYRGRKAQLSYPRDALETRPDPNIRAQPEQWNQTGSMQDQPYPIRCFWLMVAGAAVLRATARLVWNVDKFSQYVRAGVTSKIMDGHNVLWAPVMAVDGQRFNVRIAHSLAPDHG